MLDFTQDSPPKSEPVFNVQEVPKEMDIYFRAESDFLPPGKKWSDLTPEEARMLQSQYRFSPFRPGLYQTLTGFRNSG